MRLSKEANSVARFTFEIPSKVCGKDDLKGALAEANRCIEKGKPYCIFIKEGTLE